MPTPQSRRLADGSTRWFVRFRADGRQTSLPFASSAEADRFARDVEQRGGQWAFDNYMREEELEHELTLSQWAEQYFAGLTVSPGSLAEYKRIWKASWQPHLGHMKLSQIQRADVVTALKAQTGAPRTVANAWGSVLAPMLKAAVVESKLDRSPAKGVKLPEHELDEGTEHRYMTADELLQVIEDTRPRYKPLMWMLVGTGMRWSEATALTVGDVDLAAKTVRVTKAWKRDRANRTYYIGNPKTKKAKRTIALPNEVVDAVRPLVENRAKSERLFTSRTGEYVKHQTFYREHWRKHCTKNIPEPRPRIHDIRHSHVALLIAAGVSLPVIQARLGHEKITTTIDTYGHLLPDLVTAAADAASKVLSTASPAALRG